MSTYKRLLIGLIGVVFVCGTLAMLIPTAKQAEATGFSAYFKKDKCEVPPTWGDIIHGKKRWVKKMGGAAYCDRQTGLVWEAEPSTDRFMWAFVEDDPGAIEHCINRIVGTNGQKGWRLPSIPELASLVDATSSTCTDGAGSICLPDGHPFQNVLPDVSGTLYHSATTKAAIPDAAWYVAFRTGEVFSEGKKTIKLAWCVRGAMSADAY